MGGRRDRPAPRGANPAAGVAAPAEGVAARAEVPFPWNRRDQARTYRDLEHPADLLLEITGPDLAGLFENALFALYDQLAKPGESEADRELLITLEEASPPDLLRALLNEALYRFETEGFVAAGARVTVETGAFPVLTETAANQAGGDRPEQGNEPQPDSGPRSGGGSEGGRVKAVTRLWGENAPAGCRALGIEIKAVTYHRLAVERRPDGSYMATVLFDV